LPTDSSSTTPTTPTTLLAVEVDDVAMIRVLGVNDRVLRSVEAECPGVVIVARGNTITGSVGVIMQWPEVSGLLDKLGVKMNEVKSGSLKAAPSMFQPVDEEARRVTQEMVSEGQQWFLDLVRTRRKLDPAGVPGLVSGRVYSGRLALKHKLVDEIGGEDTARKWLVEKRKVSADLKIVDWKPESPVKWPFPNAISAFFADVAARTIGRIGQTAAQDERFGRLGLDGFVSVWQPGKN
jgi:protease-4